MKTGLVLFLLFSLGDLCAQNSDWTVKYHDGRGKIVALPNSQLVSVTSETLNVVVDGVGHNVLLFLLFELSHPNYENSYVTPMVIGAMIGGTFGFTASTLIQGQEPGITGRSGTRSEVTALFGVIGAGLGLAQAFDSEQVRYRFTGMVIPEKRAAINQIMEKDKLSVTFQSLADNVGVKTKRWK